MGKLGFDKNRKHPPAPNLALSAISKHKERCKSILKTNISERTIENKSCQNK